VAIGHDDSTINIVLALLLLLLKSEQATACQLVQLIHTLSGSENLACQRQELVFNMFTNFQLGQRFEHTVDCTCFSQFKVTHYGLYGNSLHL